MSELQGNNFSFFLLLEFSILQSFIYLFPNSIPEDFECERESGQELRHQGETTDSSAQEAAPSCAASATPGDGEPIPTDAQIPKPVKTTTLVGPLSMTLSSEQGAQASFVDAISDRDVPLTGPETDENPSSKIPTAQTGQGSSRSISLQLGHPGTSWHFDAKEIPRLPQPGATYNCPSREGLFFGKRVVDSTSGVESF